MLTLKNISKEYRTGTLVQKALDDVSITLRQNEFVCILGPSGSGKTTLLNIIGGLDRYDSGDLIINNISTKKYTDRDWDSYRNHTIGFVFQSYNLIPHQSILSNVELALTISGISKKERTQRAYDALDKVGLKDQAHKKPNQMSGGQMQRVAIARALVNDPDILLADEPTGALDSVTSVQVMNLLKEVAKDRLVVMVTHNPELASEYGTRIVKLKDGKIVDDSDPCEEVENVNATHKNMGKSSMSFFTALSLSFNNLKTKKGRTILTSFAGSIGIIGIALILSLSNGVNTYIDNIQKTTMSNYPISITKTAIDLSSFMDMENGEEKENRDDGKIYSNTLDLRRQSLARTSVVTNNLKTFKEYLDNEDSEIHKYVGENGIVYNYNVGFSVYTYDPSGTLVNTDGSTLSGSSNFFSSMVSFGSSSNNFEQMLSGTNGALINQQILDEYNLVYGEWPDKYDEVVLVVDKNNEVVSSAMYKLGLLNSQEYIDINKEIKDGGTPEIPVGSVSYEDILNKTYYILTTPDYYKQNDSGLYESIKNNQVELENLFEETALKIKIVGIITKNPDSETNLLSSPIGYTKALNDWMIDHINNSTIVTKQNESEDVSVLTGMTFAPSDDSVKIKDAKTYVESLNLSEKAKLYQQLSVSLGTYMQIRNKSELEIATMMDEYMNTATDEQLVSLYDKYISSGTLSETLTSLGVIDLSNPSSIDIYVDNFENKDKVKDAIAAFNNSASDEDKITYTDYVGLIMSSVTTIVNVISYVLIAFVGVSLVVSSIMIGIITYISVLERTKEIGILRAIGASKRNISQVFNAETFIIGLLSGVIGIGFTELIIIPLNLILHALTGYNNVNAILPIVGAIVLVILSVGLTLIAGLIPSRVAAKKDPVIALRTE